MKKLWWIALCLLLLVGCGKASESSTGSGEEKTGGEGRKETAVFSVQSLSKLGERGYVASGKMEKGSLQAGDEFLYETESGETISVMVLGISIDRDLKDLLSEGEEGKLHIDGVEKRPETGAGRFVKYEDEPERQRAEEEIPGATISFKTYRNALFQKAEGEEGADLVYRVPSETEGTPDTAVLVFRPARYDLADERITKQKLIETYGLDYFDSYSELKDRAPLTHYLFAMGKDSCLALYGLRYNRGGDAGIVDYEIELRVNTTDLADERKMAILERFHFLIDTLSVISK